jgi:preprotein translocase subunit SecY
MKFFSTIKNIFEIEELRNRIINTIGFILIFRIGTYIMLPGLNYDVVNAGESEGLLKLFDTFLGGAFGNKAIFGLGIMPYISASIIIQLLQVAVLSFQRMQKEGESGRKKMTQITRVLTIGICIIQCFGFLATINDEMLFNPENRQFFNISAIFILTSGTMFCMWLGEKITEKGIGIGISMLIMIGIISRLPAALLAEASSKGLGGALFIVLEILAWFFIIMGVVMITQATRRIPVNYAKQVIGNKVYGGQRQFIPLKVNAAGVMPIIFAQSLMFLPALIAQSWAEDSTAAAGIVNIFRDYTSFGYNIVFLVMIVLFTYFYTAITVQPNQIADDLKRNGGFVPGIKPGLQTADYIDNVLSKITLPGALAIAVIAILPAIAAIANVSDQFALFYGGTSLLIMVGVVLDTVQQIDSYLLMKKYEGMMKSGKVKDKSQPVAVA